MAVEATYGRGRGKVMGMKAPVTFGPKTDRPARPPSAHIRDEDVDAIPPALREKRIWVGWKWRWKEEEDKSKSKWDKPPVDPATGLDVDATDSTKWMTFDEARQAALAAGLDGAGITMGAPDNRTGVVGVDLDKCVDDQGNIAEWASKIVQKFSSYTERTPSGHGLRVYIWGTKPGDENKCRTNKHPGIEIYQQDRYFTVTGRHLEGTPTAIAQRDQQLAELYFTMWPELRPTEASTATDGDIWDMTVRTTRSPLTQRATNGSGPLDHDDAGLIDKIRASKQGPLFSDLFDRGAVSRYGDNHSSADAALLLILAFWTARDASRMERIFNLSALAKRGKWTDREDYRERSIKAAVDACAETYGSRTRPSDNGNEPHGSTEQEQEQAGTTPGGDKQGKGDDKFSWIVTDYATLADADGELKDTAYAWDLWIPGGSMTAVVADAGLGKTRTAAEWCARLWHGKVMPDGAANRFPAGTKTLWLCYDRNWRGLVRSFTQFGVPREAVILPAHKNKPRWIPDFDNPKTMEILRRFIEVHKPGWVVVDTTTYASIYNTGKPNEAKLAYDPIMDVLMQTGCACLALTHTNREGGILNRRFLERCRVKIEITRPDPTFKDRLRIEVTKSDDIFPPPLGATFTDSGVVYDGQPPEAPASPQRGRKPTTSPGIAEFLWEYLQAGPAFVCDIVRAAQDKGLLKSPTVEEPKPSISSLYDARRWVARSHPGKIVHQFEMATERGRMLKAWKIEDASVEAKSEAESMVTPNDDDYTNRDW